MEKKRYRVKTYRNLADLRRDAFWRGLAGGFAGEHSLLLRWSLNNLTRSDTIAQSWKTVAECLNAALDDASALYGPAGIDFEPEPESESGGFSAGEPDKGGRATAN